MATQRRTLGGLIRAALIVLGSIVSVACDLFPLPPAPPGTSPNAIILLLDTAGVPVVGATVYAVPAGDVAELSASPITLTAGNYTADALKVDEPLEDLVNGNFIPSSGGVGGYFMGLSDENGQADLSELPSGADDRFFIYVAPADAGHLPGGSMARDAVTGASLNANVTTVEVSTTPSGAASYVGTSVCLLCHSDQATQKQTAHRHGIMVAGSPSNLQDLARFDDDDGIYDYMAGIDMFESDTTIWFYDYNAGRGFDKFKTLTTDPTLTDAGAVVWAKVRLYNQAGKYYMEFTNVINPSDPNNGMIRETLMTYGGGVYKQRYLTSYGDSKSLYVLPVQFQPSGDDAAADRTRKVYRDYHLDYWMHIEATPSDSTFKELPAVAKSFDLNCASCHFTGFSIAQDAGSGEYIASAVGDANGETHPLTGRQQELNVGCETCHGPGSEHVYAGGNGVAIVSPSNLPVERASMICGQCHSRPKGNDSFGAHGDAPLNAADQMMRPGTSRAAFLADHTSRNDATTSDFWADGLHSKSHHQQYTDFISTAKYRNGLSLKTCTDCHDIHAPGSDRHQLNGMSDNSLCVRCHADYGDLVAHMMDKTGYSMGPDSLCTDCHSPNTAKSGAGETTANWIRSGSGTTYYHGDISSHRLDVPTKADASPANPMPVAYTNACGLCHFGISGM